MRETEGGRGKGESEEKEGGKREGKEEKIKKGESNRSKKSSGRMRNME